MEAFLITQVWEASGNPVKLITLALERTIDTAFSLLEFASTEVINATYYT